MKQYLTIFFAMILLGCASDNSQPAETSLQLDKNSCIPPSGVAIERFTTTSGTCPDQTDAVLSLDDRNMMSTTPGFSAFTITSGYNDGCDAYFEAHTKLVVGTLQCDVKAQSDLDWTPAKQVGQTNADGETVLANGVFAIQMACPDGEACSGVYDSVVVRSK
jgi:hypothetical protein